MLTFGPVLYRRNVRNSKYDALVEEVELLESNPAYAHIRLPDGREETVSLRQLAPTESRLHIPVITPPESIVDHTVIDDTPNASESDITPENTTDISAPETNVENLLLQQQRVRPHSLRNRDA